MLNTSQPLNSKVKLFVSGSLILFDISVKDIEIFSTKSIKHSQRLSRGFHADFKYMLAPCFCVNQIKLITIFCQIINECQCLLTQCTLKLLDKSQNPLITINNLKNALSLRIDFRVFCLKSLMKPKPAWNRAFNYLLRDIGLFLCGF